jgi:hypothetical protein
VSRFGHVLCEGLRLVQCNRCADAMGTLVHLFGSHEAFTLMCADVCDSLLGTLEFLLSQDPKSFSNVLQLRSIWDALFQSIVRFPPLLLSIVFTVSCMFAESLRCLFWRPRTGVYTSFSLDFSVRWCV